MIKKTVITAAAALVVSLFFLGRDLVSYVRTSAGYVQSSVTDSVPMEFQITRARGMIDDLVPEIKKNMHVIAKEEVEVENLDKQIADTQKRLAKDKEEILRLKTDAESKKPAFEYAGRTYTAEQVKQDLANRFDRYKNVRGDAGQPAGDLSGSAEELGCGPAEARGHAGGQAAVVRRGGESPGPATDDCRRPDHQSV